jgi:hypothetical protein
MGQEEPTQSVAGTIDDEVLRARIRKIAEQPHSSRWRRFSTNPLTPIILGFVLTGVVGVILTDHYNRKLKELELAKTEQLKDLELTRTEQLKQLELTKNQQLKMLELSRTEQQKDIDRAREDERRKSDTALEEGRRESDRRYNSLQKSLEDERTSQQQELSREHAFFDELSKMRVQRIGEVWEHVYLYEAAIQESDAAFKAAGRSSLGSKAGDEKWKQAGLARQRSTESKGRLKDALDKDRFWIGEDLYAQIQEYVHISEVLAAQIQGGATITEQERQNQGSLREKADNLRATFHRIRNELLRE